MTNIKLLSELAKELPSKPSYKTVWRWAQIGCVSETGKTIYLKTWNLPGGLGSSIDAYNKFINDLQE